MNNITTPALLRQAADLIEAHPGLPAPVVTSFSDGSVDVAWQLMNGDAKDDQKVAVRQIIKAIGGKWNKADGGDTLYLRSTRDGLKLSIYVTRDQVCERIVTGTKSVTIPAKPRVPARVVEVEDVEWRCEPVLAEAVSA